MALQMWQAVIDSTGLSRFPIDRAELESAFAQQLLDTAAAIIQEEHAALPIEETNGIETPDVEMSDD